MTDKKFRDQLHPKYMHRTFGIRHLSGYCSLDVTLFHYAVYKARIDIIKVEMNLIKLIFAQGCHKKRAKVQ